MAGLSGYWSVAWVLLAALLPAARAQGACLAAVPAGNQCGGNESNPILTCASFSSCANQAWDGACCPAGAPCAQLGGPTCWTCGGQLPAYLRDLPDTIEGNCTRMVNGDFDYGCALGASMFFYMAQRTGRLPADNPVPWRGDSGLNDTAPNGQSISGGWFDAGDTTRFTFPAAYSMATLALGFIAFPEGYQRATQVAELKANLRWGADWLLKARYSPQHLVAATWAPGASIRQAHLFWGHPEDIRTPASVRVLGPGQPGADLLAQAAAALAATAVVLRQDDPDYAGLLVSEAQGLFTQAKDQEGLYSDSVPEVAGFYTSFSFIDDLAWAAAWIALATGDEGAAEEARLYWLRHITDEGGGEGRRFDYNNLQQGVGYLMHLLQPAKKDQYLQPIRDVTALWLEERSDIKFTSKGMAYIDTWGNLRYVANQALMALLHNKAYKGEYPHRALVYACFARKQARIMLGETGRSYVVGVGTNPVCRPHHRASSCGALSGRCDCSALRNPGCNPNVLYGALVGGPNADGEFKDDRNNYEQNEVALDWNAGFSGVLAGLAAGGMPSWEECRAAGLADGRGGASPDLSGAAAARAGWGAAAAAAAAAFALGALLA
ncbi:endoglucanase A [Raphidocelis subcapitata]|uniref:Endoglucanase n=1 Tax=Raphidocelis subcapitata TaxID=307507 RepID=A0A2V0P4J5_9CHLO|nr:endoglucanase A [Raphidocelis subcapitata]|eukprot:GBF92005.1 endoglucanase A [Raphidocelis subcapitata]